MMKQLEIVGIGVGIVFAIGFLLGIRALFRFISEHGIEIIFMRLLIGRQAGHHHRQRNTNATFWRDSDGKTYGRVTTRVSKRHHRAGYKNLLRAIGYIFGSVGFIYGLITNWLITVILTGLLFVTLITIKIIRTITKARNWYRTKNITAPLAAAMSTIAELEDADMEKAINVIPEFLEIERGEIGRITFPDGFHANDAQKEVTSKLVKSRFPVPVELKWKTTPDPENKKGKLIVARIVTAPPLPRMVHFNDHLEGIEALGWGEYIIGIDGGADETILSHNSDRVMKAFSMNSNCGKTVMLGSIGAQLLGNDPNSDLTGFDVKRVSLEFMKDIPGCTIFSDPKNMEAMWDGWYALKNEMERRYELKQAGKQTVFPRHYIFLEEGNTFATKINAYYKYERRQKGEGLIAPIWYDAIAPILWEGREVGFYVVAVLQNFMERYFGNISLRPAFGTIGMAGFKPNQFNTIVQTRPIPECQEGHGRIYIVDGTMQKWVQGLYGTECEFKEYAMRNRHVRLELIEGTG